MISRKKDYLGHRPPGVAGLLSQGRRRLEPDLLAVRVNRGSDEHGNEPSVPADHERYRQRDRESDGYCQRQFAVSSRFLEVDSHRRSPLSAGADHLQGMLPPDLPMV